MTAEWWHDQPAPIVAVLNLANLDDGGLIARTFAPEHADEIERLGEDLRWISMLRTDEPRTVLTAYYPGNWLAGDSVALADRCDEYANDLQADVLVRAALIASLVTGRRAA